MYKGFIKRPIKVYDYDLSDAIGSAPQRIGGPLRVRDYDVNPFIWHPAPYIPYDDYGEELPF